MANEIEKKFRLSKGEFETLDRDLRLMEAEFVGLRQEENLIYSGDLLLEKGAVIRIRKTDGGATLTFKKWLPQEDDLKRHVEHETGIDDPDEVAAMLDLLGLDLVLVYEKKRRIFKVRGAEVVLDELPFGFFMEIEADPASIREVEMILDAEKLTHEPLTYPRLTEKYGRKNGSVFEARFA